MPSNTSVNQPETFEWILWFSELPARVSWQMVKDALKIRVARGIRNVRHGGPRFISADVGTPDNGKRLFDEIARTGIEGLEECSFTIAWGYIIRGERVYSVKCEEQKYVPPRHRQAARHIKPVRRASPGTQHWNMLHWPSPLLGPDVHRTPQETMPFSNGLIIYGLPLDMTPAGAEQYLSKFGDIVACQISGPSECTIQYKYPGDAHNAASQLHGQWIGGYPLQVLLDPLPSPSPVGCVAMERSEIGQLPDKRARKMNNTFPEPEKLPIETHGGGQTLARRSEMHSSHETSSSPVTDAEGRSIVGNVNHRSKAMRRIPSERIATHESDSENDMSG